MANEFKIKNGLKFPDNTIQLSAANPRYNLFVDTSSNSPTILTTTGETANSSNQVIVFDNSANVFSGIVIAKERGAAGVNYAAWEIKGAILKGDTAASTTLGQYNINTLTKSAGAASWTISLSADTTNGCLNISGTGGVSTLIRWTAAIQSTDSIYGPPTYETLAPTADIWFDSASLSSLTTNSKIASWTNKGTTGSTYDATESTLGPRKVIYNGYTALQFSSTDKRLVLANELTITGGTLFMVGHQTASRLIAFGGVLGTGPCFFGYSGDNGTGVLYRNTFDGGLTLSSLNSVSGLKAFGLTITGTSSTTYFDNSTSPVSSSGAAGTYKFKKIGVRDYGSTEDSQPSTGYLTEILYFSTPLSNDDAATMMTGLKTKYGIA